MPPHNRQGMAWKGMQSLSKINVPGAAPVTRNRKDPKISETEESRRTIKWTVGTLAVLAFLGICFGVPGESKTEAMEWVKEKVANQTCKRKKEVLDWVQQKVIKIHPLTDSEMRAFSSLPINATSFTSISTVFESALSNSESEESTESESEDAKSTQTTMNVAMLALFPATAMLAGSLIVFVIKFSPTMLHCLQHFAGGILLSAICTELVPTVVEASNRNPGARRAIAIGFSLGVFVMLCTELINDEDDEDEDDDSDDDLLEVDLNPLSPSREQSPMSGKPRRLSISRDSRSPSREEDPNPLSPSPSQDQSPVVGKPRRLSLSRNSRTTSIGKIGLTRPSTPRRRQSLRRLSSRMLKANSMDSTSNGYASKKNVKINLQPTITEKIKQHIPWARVIAIELDAMIDGMLLGLVANIGSHSTTSIMDMAISIEMCFVGVAYGAGFKDLGWKASLPFLVSAPLTIVFGATVGHLLSELVHEHQMLHIGFVSFGASALLYLVCEDLLIESHIEGEEKVREVLGKMDKGIITKDFCLEQIREAVAEVGRWYEDVWFFVGFLISVIFSASE